ncbi:hypothetical protein BX666DRAFT_1942580, partial [Dichotomocladium elegans]
MISINAFYELCKFLEARGAKSVQCFPLRTSSTWGKVLDLKSKAFKDRHGRRFLGSVQTDGVSVLIILKAPDAKRSLSRKRNRADDDGTRGKDTRRKQSKHDQSAD